MALRIISVYTLFDALLMEAVEHLFPAEALTTTQHIEMLNWLMG